MGVQLILFIIVAMTNTFSTACACCNCVDEIYDLKETLVMETEAKINRAVAAIKKPRDCQDVFDNGFISDGIYTIHPKGHRPLRVRCNMTTEGGGWTVIQRRQRGTHFFQTWAEYVVGFGDDNFNDFWLGLESIHALTSQATYELRIDMKKANGVNAAAKYQVFKLGDNMSKYVLYVDTYSFDPDYVDPGDSLSYHSGAKFSTKDRDHDTNSGSCSSVYWGAWWYKSCLTSNLNGEWNNSNNAKGPIWKAFTGFHNPLVFTQMMIRRLN